MTAGKAPVPRRNLTLVKDGRKALRERAVLLAKLEPLLDQLVDQSSASAKEDAQFVVQYALRVLVGLAGFDGPPVVRAARTLRGHMTGARKYGPDPLHVVAVIHAIRDAANVLDAELDELPADVFVSGPPHPRLGVLPEHVVLATLRAVLRKVDDRFENATDEALLATARRFRDGSQSGAIAEIMRSTGALDTPPSTTHAELQRQVAKILRKIR